MSSEDELADVSDKYELLEILGEGSFGVVRKCRERATGRMAAVKTIDKSCVNNLTSLEREVELLREVHHPHIIQLYDIYEDSDYLHLVTELCTGGELYDKVIEKTESEEGHFSEDDAACLIRDILEAMRYIHDELHIVHRDLKPENFLLSDNTDDAQVKIIDFGLSRRDDAPFGIMSSRVGTPYYVAPEVLYDCYTYKCDIWSIGVITYILLCGYCPFAGDTDCETLNLVKEGILEFPSPEWDSISDEAMDFIRQLLDRNPKTRPTAAQAMKHPWIAKVVVKPGLPPPRPFVFPKTSSPTSEGEDRPTSLLSELRMNSTRASAFHKYLVASKVKKALARASVDLTPKEAALLGEVFQRVDEDRDGCITTSDLEGALKADTFSSVVRRNLKQMKSHLLRNPSVTFDIRPYMPFVKQRARSDVTKGRKL